MEPVLAIFHYLMVFAVLALLLGEFLLLRLETTGPGLKLLVRVDLLFGLFALLVLVSGMLRVFLGDIPLAKWGMNHAFWTKMTVFLVIAGLSVFPTLRYIGWKKAYTSDGTLPDARSRKKASLFVHIELGLFVLIPILAVLMVQAAEK